MRTRHPSWPCWTRRQFPHPHPQTRLRLARWGRGIPAGRAGRGVNPHICISEPACVRAHWDVAPFCSPYFILLWCPCCRPSLLFSCSGRDCEAAAQVPAPRTRASTTMCHGVDMDCLSWHCGHSKASKGRFGPTMYKNAVWCPRPPPAPRCGCEPNRYSPLC